MIFYGWNRIIEKNLGSFQGSVCEVCGNSGTWELIIRRTFFTLFFVPIICYRSEYYCRCISCTATKQLDKIEAKNLMERYLPQSRAKLVVGNMARYFLLIAIASFIVFSIVMPESDTAVAKNNDNTSVDKLKAMTEKDGEYVIYNSDGDLMAEISAENGEKRADYYYEYYPYNGEDVPDGHDFECIYYYYERNKNEIELFDDDAMTICDENFVAVRYFYYDSYKDEIFWYYGLKDFGAIEYSPGRVVYPMERYTGETDTEYYTKIRVDDGINNAVMTFFHGTNVRDQNTLVMLDISIMDDEANTEERLIYYNVQGISSDSTMTEILDYIKCEDIHFDIRDYRHYYEGKYDVIDYRVYEWLESDKEHREEIKYEITLNENNYYIAKLVP